tara:strand:- start:1618 stop:2355 length:738 start_codon:yes stop_codon:yes gene_type:complete
MKLTNKIIVLTGGSSGVGLDILRHIVGDNMVINLSRTAPEGGKLPAGASFTHIPTDFSKARCVVTAIAEIQERFPDGINGLINCAAVQYTPRLTDPNFDPANISEEIAINLTSPISLIAGLLGSLRQGTESFILNINSGLGIVPKDESAVYCATKAGLDNFSRGLRAQLESTQVSVLQAFLPLVDTPMTKGRGTGKLHSSEVASQIIAGIEREISDNDIGKVKLLRTINRFFPSIANRIMQKGNA